MKAYVKLGANSEQIELMKVAIPQIGDDEILVQIKAIGVGIHDSYFLPADAQYPYPIGIEAAGVVDKVGSGVSGYKTGDRIAFVSAMQPKGGTWAEYVAVNANSLIVQMPADMSFVEAAALPVAGNTILRAIQALEGISRGGSVFIAGGSGAIGTLAIQLAKKRGLRVAASASERNHEYMRELGAEKVVDYHDANWIAQILEWVPGGVDGAIAIQPKTTGDSVRVVKDGGKVISISGDQDKSDRVTVEIVSHHSDVRQELTQMLTDVAEKDLHVEIEKVYAFEHALDALKKTQTRSARGKSVIQL